MTEAALAPSSRRALQRRGGQILAAAWLAASVARMVLARWIPTPQIVPDEVRFIGIANDIARGSFRGSLSLFADYPFAMYPALLAPIFRLLPGHAYTATKVFNALLASSACFPSWLLARRVLPRQWALAVALLTLCLPGLGYASTVMAENVYVPLSLWTVELALRWIATRRAGWSVAWGAALALAGAGLILTKPQGIYVLAGLAGLPLVPAFGGAWRRRAAWVLRLGGAAAASGLVFVFMGYVRLGSALWGRAFEPWTWLGFYAKCLHLADNGQTADELRAWLVHLLASGGELLPVVGILAFAMAVDTTLHGRRRAARLLGPLFCVLWPLFTRVGIRLALYYDHAFNIHERYAAQLAPILLILAAECLWRRRPALIRIGALAAAAVGITIALTLCTRFRTYHLVNDAPGLSWVVAVPAEVVIGVLCVAGALAAGWLLWCCDKPRRLAFGIAAAMAATSFGFADSQQALAGQEHARKVKLVPFATKLARGGQPLFFLMDELDIWQIWMAEAFTGEGEGRAYCFGENDGNCLSTELEPDGEIAVLKTLPSGSLLVTSDAIGLDAPLADSQGPYRAYRLTGNPVRLLTHERRPWPYP